VGDDLAALDDAELGKRIEAARERMRPVEQELAGLRGARDVLLTERRRRERNASRESRAGLKAAMKEGQFPTVAELVASGEDGAFDVYLFNLKTGGEVRLGYPGAKVQSLGFTNGVEIAQAQDLAEAFRLYSAGWELGSPGRTGVRVHFPGTRQERLIGADEVYARRRNKGGDSIV
jgi:hypothetical protein